ncbi:MAG TPA: hypothetical protein VJ696_01660 [Rhodanobacteraceae bacterium]|nr:hypothetical protein [Rhodanobacteraceae bacterium]
MPNECPHGIATLAIAAFVASATAWADAPPMHYCDIAIDFSIDGRTIAAPAATVEFGNEAEITIGDPDQHAWRFRILAEQPTLVRRANVIPVSIALEEIAEGQAYARISPHFGAVPGQRAEIDAVFPHGDGRTAHLVLMATPRLDDGAASDGAPP